jgi:hypothetical protein
MSRDAKHAGPRYAFSAVLAVGLITLLASLAGAGSAASTTAPSNNTPPTLTGTPQEGQTLAAEQGTYSGTTPIRYVFQYRRCDKNGGSCSDIGGTTTQKIYKLTSADVNNTVRVRVTATNSDGSVSATSVPTPVIQPAAVTPPPVTNGCPSGTGTIDINKVSLPARLAIDGQQSSPSTVTRSTSDLVLRFHVSACKGRSVQGALVYATAVPFEQFDVPPEAVTGADGYATLTLHQASRFPASSRQQLLAVFVRARKSGEDLTGGVSTRLLVSFPVSLQS